MPDRIDTIEAEVNPTNTAWDPRRGLAHEREQVVVRVQDEGRRLDHFLAERYDFVSRSRFKKLILDGRITVNGKRVKPSRPLTVDDRIEIFFPVDCGDEPLVARPMPLDILYEDDAVLVINKAAGIVVHPGAGHRDGTLIQGILAHCPRLATQGAPLRPGIVHRLDQDTSGALVFAKTDRAYLRLVDQFKRHRVEKTYLALVYGQPPESGELRTSMNRHPKNRKKMAVAATGREAVSRWRVMERFGDVSLLEVGIETGRTHQIRVHMSHLHHPVLGDETYGGGRKRLRSIRDKRLLKILSTVKRQMLHAYRLGFYHPDTAERLSFEAALPDDFRLLLADLRAISGSGHGIRSAETVQEPDSSSREVFPG